ncbi:MAG: hypothetical protein Q9208_000254 [Pyrenodesmia sp. 3 TL-2023]
MAPGKWNITLMLNFKYHLSYFVVTIFQTTTSISCLVPDTMADLDVFAVLIPVDTRNLAGSAFGLPQNANIYRKPTINLMREPTISSREPTPDQDDSSSFDNLAKYAQVAQIVLRFHNGPKDPLAGWAFGTNEAASDVLLGFRGTRSISGLQFTISITDDYHIVLRDNSRFGTAVGYDGKARDQSRTNYSWTLALAPGATQNWGEVRIYVPNQDGLAFIIDFPNHRAGEEKYLDHLDDYLAARNLAVPLVGAMGLNSTATTAPPTGIPTPKKQGAVYFKCGWVGEGSCGEVYKVTDTRNGQIYAAKYAGKLSNKNPKKRKVNYDGRMEAIRNEVATMKNLSHVNVMRLVDFLETPQLMLVMPYYPHGSLEEWCKGYGLRPRDDRHPRFRLQLRDRTDVFIQILLGLTYLHQMDVAHRDLKPANIIVARKRPLLLVIADFGLAKLVQDSPLVTDCGTPIYTAPEVSSRDYSPKADTWSLAVLMMAVSYGLPAHLFTTGSSQGSSGRWPEALVEFVAHCRKDTIDNLIYVLGQMVQIDPGRRPSVEECFELGCENGLFRKRSDGTIVVGQLETLYTDEEMAERRNRRIEVDESGSSTPTRQSSHGKSHGGPVLRSGSTTPTQPPAQRRRKALDNDSSGPARGTPQENNDEVDDHGIDASTLRFGNDGESQKTARADWNGSLGSWGPN